THEIGHVGRLSSYPQRNKNQLHIDGEDNKEHQKEFHGGSAIDTITRVSMNLAPMFEKVSETPSPLSQDISINQIGSMPSSRESKELSKNLTGDGALSNKITKLSNRDANSVMDSLTCKENLNINDQQKENINPFSVWGGDRTKQDC
ncbi:hypothetical protein PIB30_108090, partial [Stylosanthes scabra]|nr:hypothetical protein [Stylosanthes scabra]